MKENIETIMNNCKNITSLARIEDLNSRELRDKESLPPSSMKIFFLVTVMLVETLDRKQFIAKPMQGVTI